MRVLKWIWNFVSNAAQAWQLWASLAPVGLVTAMTGIFARSAELPWYLILLSALAAFCFAAVGVAAIFHALLRQNEWHHRTTAEGKLDYLQPHFGVDVHWSDAGVPEYIDKMNIGLTILNRALSTLEFKVISFHALIEGRGPDTDRFVGKTVSIVSGAMASTYPEPVTLTDLHKLDVKGTLEFELIYGKPNNLRYTIKRKQEFDFVVHAHNSVKPNPIIGCAVRDKN